jgi:hypothetical protein
VGFGADTSDYYNLALDRSEQDWELVQTTANMILSISNLQSKSSEAQAVQARSDTSCGVLRMELKRRGMDIDTRCVMCCRQNEDGGHLFFRCKYARHLWQALNLNDLRELLREKQSAKEVVREILKQKQERQLLAVVLLWLWWQERNSVREGDKRREAVDLAFIIQKQATEFGKISQSVRRGVELGGRQNGAGRAGMS